MNLFFGLFFHVSSFLTQALNRIDAVEPQMKHGVNTDDRHDGNESLDEGFSLFGASIALRPAQQNDRPRPCPVGVPSVATECFRLNAALLLCWIRVSVLHEPQ